MNHTEYFSTGNQYISIPEVYTKNAGIACIGFVIEKFRSLVEIHGSDTHPFIAPYVEYNGENIFDTISQKRCENYWIPSFDAKKDGLECNYRIVPALHRRSFTCILTLKNTSDKPINTKSGIMGSWKNSYHIPKIKKNMFGTKRGRKGRLNSDITVFEFRGNTPIFAVAIHSENTINNIRTGFENPTDSDIVTATNEQSIFYERTKDIILPPGESFTLPFYIGIGLEEVSASSAAMEIQMQGYEKISNALRVWLDLHTVSYEDKFIDDVINFNAFYNYFYSQAYTLDTEKLVMTVSKSSRSSFCSSYMDRAVMRYSFPAAIHINWSHARNMLIYAFTTQIKNLGIRSRFIDGITLEDGFELDQLCAPIRALSLYIQLTNDVSILFDMSIQDGINYTKTLLQAQKHRSKNLFETLLKSNGEYSKLPYVCFQNMLTWRIMLDMCEIYKEIRDLDRADEAKMLADKIREDINNNFIIDGKYGKMYAYSIDLEGNYIIDDEPEGSLQLMTYFGFCKNDDPIYQNTLKYILDKRSKEKNINVLSIINDIRTSRCEDGIKTLRSLSELPIAKIIADSEETGELHNAAVAGALAFSLRLSLETKQTKKRSFSTKDILINSLYQAPPEVMHNMRKSRL